MTARSPRTKRPAPPAPGQADTPAAAEAVLPAGAPPSVPPGQGGAMRDIWRLAWPQTLMMLFHFLIGFVDVTCAGRIGAGVQAAMGMVGSLLFFFLVVATAVANGSVAAISQSMGAGRHARVRRYVGLVLLFAAVTGVCVLLLGLPIKGLVLGLLRVPRPVAPVMDAYYDVFLLLLPIYYVFIVTNALFRAQKRVLEPLYAMILTTAVNTFGDLAFGLGWWGFPNFGYKGLAWATFLSVTAGMALNLWLLRRAGLLSLDVFPPWRWARAALPYVLKVAWPGGLMQLVWHSAYLALFAIVAALPMGAVPALAGMTAGLRVESLLFLPGFAFNMTASILVGQRLGEGRPDKARADGFRVLGLGVGVISLLAVALWLFVRPIAAFVAPESAVQTQTIDYLAYNLLAIPFTLTTMTLSGALTGAGATLYNLLAFGGTAWLVRLPLAWWLGHVVMQRAEGIWLAMLISQALQAMIVLYIFARRDWARFAMIRKRVNNGN